MGLTRSNKLLFMMRGLADCIAPRVLYSLDRVFASASRAELSEAERRADYYCRTQVVDSPGLTTAVDFRLPRSKPRHTAYFFPLRRLLNYFPQDVRFAYLFGDVDYEPEVPTLVKSRPVGTKNGVLLPLDAIRHFRWVTDDPTPWESKHDLLVGRNEVHRKGRIPFMERWYGHERTDLGQVNADGGRPDLWLRPRMSVDEQLRYKFVACIEGNDVATNLKWVMSSNSLPVMPAPTMETWFMEGTLRAGVNYVELSPDYSDLLERMDHYLSHPGEARGIIEANHAYVKRFQNPRVERVAVLLTLRRYLNF